MQETKCVKKLKPERMIQSCSLCLPRLGSLRYKGQLRCGRAIQTTKLSCLWSSKRIGFFNFLVQN